MNLIFTTTFDYWRRVMTNKKQSMLEKALNYAKEGWAVLRLHTVVKGICSCSQKA